MTSRRGKWGRDEPSLALAPLLVEQNLHKALEVAHRGVVIETGRLRLAGTAGELSASPEMRAAYLGL